MLNLKKWVARSIDTPFPPFVFVFIALLQYFPVCLFVFLLVRVCVRVCVEVGGGGPLGRNFGSFERSDALNDLRLKGDEKIGIFELVYELHITQISLFMQNTVRKQVLESNSKEYNIAVWSSSEG